LTILAIPEEGLESAVVRVAARLERAARWSLTRRALERLLHSLSPEPEAAAREYDAMRRNLIGFFERRGIPQAESLADQTIDRVARRLDEGETVEHLRAYFFGVARRLLQELEKQRASQRAALRNAPPRRDSSGQAEAQVACLEHWLDRLPQDARSLIVDYYQSTEGCGRAERRLLAERLGITYVSLRSKAHRIRRQLGASLRECAQTSACRRHDDGLSEPFLKC
jgi:DNA-directed RNA polymerase specialized sigma24 family protein